MWQQIQQSYSLFSGMKNGRTDRQTWHGVGTSNRIDFEIFRSERAKSEPRKGSLLLATNKIIANGTLAVRKNAMPGAEAVKLSEFYHFEPLCTGSFLTVTRK
jgi:hypothetical protein